MNDTKLCAICLIRKPTKKSERLEVDVCQDCYNQIQKYFSQKTVDDQPQTSCPNYMFSVGGKLYPINSVNLDLINIRQKVQDKYQKEGLILADSPYFSDQYIESLHSQIKKISSNIKKIQQ